MNDSLTNYYCFPDRIDIMDMLTETSPSTTATIDLTTSNSQVGSNVAEQQFQYQSPSIVFSDGYWLDQTAPTNAQSDSNSNSGQQVGSDLSQTQNAIAKELGRATSTSSSSSISSMLMGRSTQDLADEIARVLVDKALDKDRKRLLHLKAVKTDRDLSKEESNIVDTYAEVAANRVLEKLLDGVLEEVASDLAGVVTHGPCQGDLSRLKLSSEVEETSSETLLQSELRNLSEEFSSAGGSYVESFGLRRDNTFVTTDSDFALPPEHPFEGPFGHTTIVKRKASRHQCSEMCMRPLVEEEREREKQEEHMNEVTAEILEEVLDDVDFSKLVNETGVERRARRRNEERRKRNGQGILLSSLKKKVYHCRCVDCQAERRAKGEPEPTEAIEVTEVSLPAELMGAIPVVKKRGRGRPRIYPRLADLALVEKQENEEKKVAKMEENKERIAVVTATASSSSPSPSSPSFVGGGEMEDSPPGQQLPQEGEKEEEKKKMRRKPQTLRKELTMTKGKK